MNKHRSLPPRAPAVVECLCHVAGVAGGDHQSSLSRKTFQEDETLSIRDPHRKHQSRPVARVTERMLSFMLF